MKYLMNEKQKDQRKHKEIVPLMTGKHSNDHHPLVTETKSRTGSLTETTPQEIVEKIFRSNNRKPMLLQKKKYHI